jgi:hypothetical protein
LGRGMLACRLSFAKWVKPSCIARLPVSGCRAAASAAGSLMSLANDLQPTSQTLLSKQIADCQ